MDDWIYYEFRVIWIATGIIVKCCSPKSFPFLKSSFELSFNRIMHTCIFQKTVQGFCLLQHMELLLWLAYSLDFRLLSTFGIWLLSVLLVIRVLLLQKKKFGCTYKQYKILFQKKTFKICFTPWHDVKRHLLKRMLVAPSANFGHLWLLLLLKFQYLFEHNVSRLNYICNISCLCIKFH